MDLMLGTVLIASVQYIAYVHLCHSILTRGCHSVIRAVTVVKMEVKFKISAQTKVNEQFC